MKLQAIRIDRTVESDCEVKLPFKCFACHDGGLAGGRFIAEFVEGDSDVPFICNRDNCDAGRIRRSAWSANNDPKYRDSFDGRLDRYACEDIHQWEKKYFIETTILNPPVNRAPIIDQVLQSISDRDKIYKQLEDAIAQVDIDITERIAKFIKLCRDRDSTSDSPKFYSNVKSLPTEAYKVLLIQIRNLST